MYPFEWIERARARPNASPARARLPAVSPTVWKLGLTSLLTDISSEMVNSLLPLYLVLHLHMNPLQFGAIDGIYNGFAIAILSLAGGIISDRTRRPREVAAFGYGVSAICKLLLLAAGTTWGWIAAVIALDRAGKGVRTAPRDALISFATPPEALASAFAVHRALDAGGALLGPMLAFVLLSKMPNAFDTIWFTSFAFALLGLAVLLLFVRNPARGFSSHRSPIVWRKIFTDLAPPQFRRFVFVGGLLSVMTLSDGFVYLLLQNRAGLTIGFFPLFYVITACCYMTFAIPLGRIADRHGRAAVFIFGNVVLAAIYLLLLASNRASFAASMICLLLFGIYYAATEGVLVAMASSVIPTDFRSRGLAILATAISAGKFCSSLIFGWLWQRFGTETALLALGAGFLVALSFSSILLPKSRDAQSA